jgi:GDP-D-mannose 3',5'-epimerase
LHAYRFNQHAHAHGRSSVRRDAFLFSLLRVYLRRLQAAANRQPCLEGGGRPHGTFDGGREKAPAAICRKVIAAKLSRHHEIEVWGDGQQTRSFMFIDDCLYGTRLLMESDIAQPINIGSAEMVTINRLIDLAEELAGIKLKRNYKLDAPKGVRGRSSDNTFLRSQLRWEPSTPLQTGLEKTYA